MRKKRRLSNTELSNGHTQLKQAKLDIFFTRGEEEIPNTQDEMNIANLIALDTPTSPIPQVMGDGECGPSNMISPSVQERRSDHIEREPILFSKSEEIDKVWVLDSNKRPIGPKLIELTSRLMKHDQNILDLSIVRVKSQISDKNFVKRPRNVPTLKMNTNAVSLSQQNEATLMPANCKTGWNQARAAAVEAAKGTNRATFYRQAPKQQLYEYWCFGLERTPDYLMKLEEFRADLHQTRIRHAQELMELVATHLEKEVQSNLDAAANLRAATITKIQQTAPDKAEAIIRESSVSYDITVANIGVTSLGTWTDAGRNSSPLPPLLATLSIPYPMSPKQLLAPLKTTRVFGAGGGGEAPPAPGEAIGAKSPIPEPTTIRTNEHDFWKFHRSLSKF